MRILPSVRITIALLGSCFVAACAAQQPSATVRLKLHLPHEKRSQPVPAVVWLEARPGTASPSFIPHDHYTLLQKDRTFTPHLQVVPVGSAVAFPNADPFFHNVFSLFNGKRFDLGLYEAGSTKSVTFSREGVSYIFCNIHPEMSAVVIALSTPLYAVADSNQSATLVNVPPGNYSLHLWIEGVTPGYLDSLTRTVSVDGENLDLGVIPITTRIPIHDSHTNKFGKDYPPVKASPY